MIICPRRSAEKPSLFSSQGLSLERGISEFVFEDDHFMGRRNDNSFLIQKPRPPSLLTEKACFYIYVRSCITFVGIYLDVFDMERR